MKLVAAVVLVRILITLFENKKAVANDNKNDVKPSVKDPAAHQLR